LLGHFLLASGDQIPNVHSMRLVPLLLAMALLPLRASAWDTAYRALRAVGKDRGEAVLNRVLEVHGLAGAPQPKLWRIVFDDPLARGGVRELEVAGGRIISERTPVRSYSGSGAAATMDFGKLNLDSDGAFGLANDAAIRARLSFDRVDYLLRSRDDRPDPVWVLRLLDRQGRHVGTIHIAADTGAILRREGFGSVRDEEMVPPERGVESGEERGGVVGHVEHFGDRVKRHVYKRGAQLQEFFTGRRTIDREYEESEPARSEYGPRGD
jgi:hypothetical protein